MDSGNLYPNKWTKIKNEKTEEIHYYHNEKKDTVLEKPAAVILDELRQQLESIDTVYYI